MTELHALVARWRGFAGNRQHERWNELQADTYRACADELAAALAETGWRPIGEMPDDVTHCWIGHGPSGTMLVCWRRASGEPWQILWSDGRGIAWTPTHWMPLPPPPAEEPGR